MKNWLTIGQFAKRVSLSERTMLRRIVDVKRRQLKEGYLLSTHTTLCSLPIAMLLVVGGSILSLQWTKTEWCTLVDDPRTALREDSKKLSD